MGTKEKREHHSYKRGGRPKTDEASSRNNRAQQELGAWPQGAGRRRASVRDTAAAVEKALVRRGQRTNAMGKARLEQERKIVDAVSAIGLLEL